MSRRQSHATHFRDPPDRRATRVASCIVRRRGGEVMCSGSGAQAPIAIFFRDHRPPFDRPHQPHHHTGDSNGGQGTPAAAVRWPKPPRSITGNRTRSPPRENRESLEELRSVPASTEIGLQNHDQQHQTALPTSPAFAARPEDPPPCHRSRTQS